MNSAGSQSFYVNGRRLQVSLYTAGREVFFELQWLDNDSYNARPVGDPCVVRVKEGAVEEVSLSAQAKASESIADMLRQALDFKRNDQGILVPNAKPGDVILVDRPGASEIKVLDPVEQSFERIPKKSMTIEERLCTCPARDLLTWGCKCGAAIK